MADIKYSNYVLAGFAAMGATLFTNPLEVIKTRIQLQGELQKQNNHVKIYRGVFHGICQVAKHDGFYGLNKGLIPALSFQFVLNFFRLGIFETAVGLGWTRDENGHMSIWRSFFYGGLSGSFGSCLASPFFLVKTHMQSYASPEIAVGFQRKHEGMMQAFQKIYSIHGIRGLYRGVVSNIPRAALGGGAQLATFEPLKEFLMRNNWNFANPTLNSFVCSAISGTAMSIAITPPDIILTRLYNQPLDDAGKGIYYKGAHDCFRKILKIEGISGLYKGFWPNYLRIAPHSTFVLLFYDEAKAAKGRLMLRET